MTDTHKKVEDVSKTNLTDEVVKVCVTFSPGKALL